jgi:hypothetical protein
VSLTLRNKNGVIIGKVYNTKEEKQSERINICLKDDQAIVAADVKTMKDGSLISIQLLIL